jgi:p-cumate 2,3-dioxygenase ferredoxin subunit
MRWVDVGSEAELAPGNMQRVELADRAAIALFNVDGCLYATQDQCTHARASLTESGRLTGLVIECGWHFGTFDVSTGQALTAPCRKALKTYRTSVVDGRILVEIELSVDRGTGS